MYYEVKAPTKGRDDKTYWLRVGTAFPLKSGDGFSVVLDAIPTATENGHIRLSLFPPKPRENAPAGNADFDDSIPF